MKALVYRGPRDMRWEEWPEPIAGSGEAIVAVRAVGICGSDVHGYTGDSGRRTPGMVMGHEFTGEVAAVGPGVPDGWTKKHVVVQPILFCGSCDQCRAGNVQRCRTRRLLGGNANGAMAERLAAPAANLMPLPENVSFEHGTLTEPLAVAIHAVRRLDSLRGCSVLIAGTGPIGLLTMIAARQAGARLIVMTDIVPQRRALATLLGADAALDSGSDVWLQELAGVVGAAEVDVAFDAVGIAPTFQQAAGSVRPGGTVIAIGGWRTIPVDLSRLVAREIHVQGTFNFTPAEFDEARRWLAEGRVQAQHIVTTVRPLAEGARAFAELADHPADAIKVVLTA